MAPAVCILNPLHGTHKLAITAVLVEDYDGFDPRGRERNEGWKGGTTRKREMEREREREREGEGEREREGERGSRPAASTGPLAWTDLVSSAGPGAGL
jgi:hypothetical protein